MTPPELRAAIHSLRWSVPTAARMLGRPYRTVAAWCTDGPSHREPDGTALLLLRLAARFPAVRRALEAWGEKGD